MEECGELTQACAKVLKYRDEEWLDRLEQECGDVMAFIHLMQEKGIISNEAVTRKKWQTITKYGRLLHDERGYNTVQNKEYRDG